ncbi:MAG TPA: hypothetical protein VE734_03240, partial [Terriglobales bacterium]|nr:hypothetical protein [Terriglobales bacterium]
GKTSMIALQSRHMELKRLINHFTYRIEPKPEGGFIAHASDPAAPAIEAVTREELQQKIQANIAASLASEFPGLKLPLENSDLKLAFHIERNPGGGFVIRSANPNAKPIEVATHNDIESHFAEKLIGFVGEHFVPELSQALTAPGACGDVKVFVDRKTFTVNSGSRTFNFSISRDLPPAAAIQSDEAKTDSKTANVNYGSIGSTISNTPITPEPSRSSNILRFLLAFLVLAALMYFLLHHR